MSSSHKKSANVELQDERVAGFQSMVGTVLKLSLARIGIEYNFAKVSTLSYKIGICF